MVRVAVVHQLWNMYGLQKIDQAQNFDLVSDGTLGVCVCFLKRAFDDRSLLLPSTTRSRFTQYFVLKVL